MPLAVYSAAERHAAPPFAAAHRSARAGGGCAPKIASVGAVCFGAAFMAVRKKKLLRFIDAVAIGGVRTVLLLEGTLPLGTHARPEA